LSTFYLFLALTTIRVNRPATTASPSSLKVSSINITQLSSPPDGESIHMLHLIEPQLSSSYRPSFVPSYQLTNTSPVGLMPLPTSQRKISSVSSRRISTVFNPRKRDSNTSQLNSSPPSDGQTRLSLPQVYKQRKQQIVPTRLADVVGLTKIRSKNLITVQS
jgi:hypothetical protein